MPAGDRKMPEPIVVPMTIATADQRPMRRSSVFAGALEGMLERVVAPGVSCMGGNARPVDHAAPERELSLPMRISWAMGVFWAAVAACAVAQVAIVRSVVASPRRRASEIAWAVLPAVALVALLFVTWRRLRPS